MLQIFNANVGETEGSSKQYGGFSDMHQMFAPSIALSDIWLVIFTAGMQQSFFL